MKMQTNLETLEEFANDLRNSLPIPQLPKKIIIERPIGTLFNIHKRSLPVALDKVVVIGLLRDEADRELVRLIRKEQKRREMDGNEIVFYFDIVPMDAIPFERSVYYNEGSPVQ